jgi:GTP-binding protein EngB required for normal cell division
MGSKLRDKLENEAFNEGVNFYRKWRQQTKNGILPIGIANVGKTTLLHKFDVDCPNLFLDFNRTLETSVDSMRLRKEFIEQCRGVEYFKKIDVPGELPEQWAKAYFDNNPRVLLILVDERPASEHMLSIKKFLSQIQLGESIWQKVKNLAAFRRNNLTRILFVINKVDKIEKGGIENVLLQYKPMLADIHTLFKSSIQIFSVSLNPESAQLKDMFNSAIDGLARK